MTDAAIAALQHALEDADPGALAALRRFKPGAPPPAAFYRVAVTALDPYLPEDGPLRDALEPRWAVLAAAMATAQDLLSPPVPLGEALAKADVAEARVLRLLDAEGAQLADLVRVVVHHLVQKGQPFDPADLARLVLENPDNGAPRRDIARTFYRHERA